MAPASDAAIRDDGTMKPPYRPVEVDGLRAALPTSVRDLMPTWAEIPEEFQHHNGNEWCRIVGQWFALGLNDKVEFHPKDGIDPKLALRHLNTIMRSWEPKHEHKEAAVAFLMSEWFTRVKHWDKKR